MPISSSRRELKGYTAKAHMYIRSHKVGKEFFFRQLARAMYFNEDLRIMIYRAIKAYKKTQIRTSITPINTISLNKIVLLVTANVLIISTLGGNR